jgi:hypothetical protein
MFFKELDEFAHDLFLACTVAFTKKSKIYVVVSTRVIIFCEY